MRPAFGGLLRDPHRRHEVAEDRSRCQEITVVSRDAAAEAAATPAAAASVSVAFSFHFDLIFKTTLNF